MAMVGQVPGMEDVFPEYKQRRREGVSEVLQEALTMLVSPVTQVAKTPAFTKMFVQALKQIKSGKKYPYSTPRQLVELARVPKKLYSRITGINWNKKMDEQGLFYPVQQKIELNPFSAEASTPWHEFTHSEQEYWGRILDRLAERKPKKKVMAHNKLFTLTDDLKELYWKTTKEPIMAKFRAGYSPIEGQARQVEERMVRAWPGYFKDVYEIALEDALYKGKQDLFWMKKGIK